MLGFLPKYTTLESVLRIIEKMEVAMELEDDLFFADLSRQISLLIMDEDEDEHPLTCSPADSIKAFSRAIHPPPQSFFLYEQAFIRRESKGTGVFIPQLSTQPRRKQRKARSSSYAKRQKQTEDNTRIPSQAPNNYSFKPRNGSG